MPGPTMRKVTVLVPNDLLERATAATGQGITQTIRLGLEALAARETYRKLQELRGRVHIDLDVEELRRD